MQKPLDARYLDVKVQYPVEQIVLPILARVSVHHPPLDETEPLQESQQSGLEGRSGEVSPGFEGADYRDGALAHEHVRGLPPVPHQGEAAEHEPDVPLRPVVQWQPIEEG